MSTFLGQRKSDVLGKHSGSESSTRCRARERGIDGIGLEEITATVGLTMAASIASFLPRSSSPPEVRAAGRFSLINARMRMRRRAMTSCGEETGQSRRMAGRSRRGSR
jgi:hypothetical protein